MAKVKNHYVDNKKFYTEMVKFINKVNEAKDEGLTKSNYPRVPEYVGLCIYEIATRLSHRPNFIGYPFREEMIGDGIENCLMYIHNFNPDKSKNPFAYFTQIIYFAFLRRIQKEQKQQYVKQKSMIESGVSNITASAEDLKYLNQIQHQMDFNMDNYSSYAEKFEKKTTKKKSVEKKGVENFMEETNEE